MAPDYNLNKGENVHTPKVGSILGSGFDLQDRLIEDYDVLAQTIARIKQMGHRVVLTQGVYDMFHVGHARYLQEAKKCGDVLVVGVDTDELTRQRKGPKRPFDTFSDRVELLATTRAVGIVTPRRVGDDPNHLIEVVRPDVLVVSKTTKDFPEASLDACRMFCGEIVMLEAQAATSTTAKLRRIMADGVYELTQKINALTTEFLSELEGAVHVEHEEMK